jgi:hypothetical protein
MSDADLIRQVADRLEIMDLMYRYCRAMDRCDHAIGYGIWNEGAVADYGADVFQGSGRDCIDHILAQHRQALSHTHQVTNILIRLDDDRAASESYGISALRLMIDGKPRQITSWIRYIDSLSRCNGRWGIDRRIAIRDLDEISDFVPLSRCDRGRRDRSDPSYAVLGGDLSG